MIKDYSLFYSYYETGDVLFVNFGVKNDKVTKKQIGNISVIYNEKTPICYEIHQITKTLKIKSKGYIFLPNSIFIDVINGLLRRANLEQLNYIDKSHYVVGKVVGREGNLLLVDDGDKILRCNNPINLAKDTVVVIAEEGALLRNGNRFQKKDNSDALLCYEDDLYLSDNHELIVLDTNIDVGQDFLKMEAL